MAVKRKANSKDSPESEEVLLSDGGDGGLFSDPGSPSGDFSAALEEVGNGELGEDGDWEDMTEDEEELEEDVIGSAEESEGTGGTPSVFAPSTNGDHGMSNGTSEDSISQKSIQYTVVEDANGNDRYVYDEINPVYESDDSDAPKTTNTIGNIPLSFYDSYPHIGYDINGKKISRPAKGEALDALLDSIEVPAGWTGLTDPATGKPLELSSEELQMLKKIQMNELPDENYNPYEPTVEYFTGKTETMPLNAAPEPKRRFVPSKHEAKRVMKLVQAIREGKIKPYKPSSDEDEEKPPEYHDLWADEVPRPYHPMHLPAPKLPPPGYEESYHPPPEYLPDESEKKAWEETDPEDRDKDFLPRDHGALRKIPGYEQFVKEKFERCLDLYLAPRVRRAKLDVDPESLLPKLPSPEELRPFPTVCATIFRGHKGRVRSLAIDPRGVWLATGGDDGFVRVWELVSGRQMLNVQLSKDEAINTVRWRPTRDTTVLAAAAGTSVFLILHRDADPETEARSREVLDAGWGYASSQNTKNDSSKESPGHWSRPGARLENDGVMVRVNLRSPVKAIAWHRRGEYFATVAPKGQSHAVAIHTLSKHLTQLPFRRLKGQAQTAMFHPSKPLFFVATQRTVRCYDLSKQVLERIDRPGARWVSSIDLHPGGNNLIIGSYDKRLLWHDLELDTKPYKTLRYHQKAIRAVRFHHGGLPLFADASDDGTIQIFHGNVVSDAMENATIVPLKVLRGHAVERELGVIDIDWHPTQPWLVSAGADGTCRLWM
jgi:ribosome biogenesis protein ERB1